MALFEKGFLCVLVTHYTEGVVARKIIMDPVCLKNVHVFSYNSHLTSLQSRNLQNDKSLD